MNDENESELRERFGRLREEDVAAAPKFHSLLERPVVAAPRHRPTRWLGSVMLAAAVLAVIAIGITRSRGPHPRYSIDLASTTWRGPTDFLLVTPDNETLRTVPRLGELDLNWRTP
ncbi:MAG: hypothetical protein ABI742_04630 [Gemmatimonadota bacterium]